MKTIYLILLITITSFVFSQKAEQIQSFADVDKPTEYYTEQAKQWEIEVNRNPKNANAWLNYFKATRINYRLFKVGTQSDLDNILRSMQKILSNTVEYNLMMYNNSNNWSEKGKYIEKAYQINTEYVEIYPSLVTYFEISNKIDRRNEVLRKWYNSNEIEAWKYYLNYNMLAFLDSNAIIFSSGDNSIYPKLLLQEGQNLRKDVKLITVPFIKNNTGNYFENLCKELNIPYLDISNFKIDKDSKSTESEQITVYKIKHIINNVKLPIYFDMGFYQYIFDSFNDNLFLEGVVYKYSTKQYNNTAVIKKNFENNYLLDYLKTDIEPVKHNSPTVYIYWYILPLQTLFHYYRESNNVSKFEETKQLIFKITDKCGFGDKARAEFNKYKIQK